MIVVEWTFPVDVIEGWVDYVALAVSLVAAAGTVAAVWASVIAARNARRDLKIESAARDSAQKQMLAHERSLSEWRELREQERFDLEHGSTPQARALRQAVLINAHAELRSTSQDLFGGGAGWIENTSGAPITDVRFYYAHGRGLEGYPSDQSRALTDKLTVEVADVPARSRQSFDFWGHIWPDAISDDEDSGRARLRITEPGFRVRFRDRLGDEWELDEENFLRLLNPKRVH